MYKIANNPNVWPVEPPQLGRRFSFAGDLTRGSVLSPVQRIVAGTVPGRDKIFSLRYFGQTYVFTGDPELSAELADETVFEKAHAPSLYALREFGGDGLFTAYNDEQNWDLAHRLLLPAFTRQAMISYHSTFTDVADEVVRRWRDAQTPVDVSQEMTRATFESIARAGFGRSYGLLGSVGEVQMTPLVRASEIVLRTGLVKGALHCVPGSRAIEYSGDAVTRRHRMYLESHLRDVVAEAAKSPRSQSRKDRKNLLELMLTESAGGDMLSHENIVYQLLTFLIAGHETTSGMLSFALHYLTRDPQLMEQARGEVDTAYSHLDGSAIGFNDVARLRFLRRVLDESLRLWPTVPGIARQPKHDAWLGGRYHMRPDNWAIIFFHHLHRHPDVWERPDEFDPSRFESTAVRKRPAHVYKPFGTGARACIGRQFAIHEALVILSRLIFEFDFTTSPTYRLKVDERLTLMPKSFHLAASRRSR